MKNKGWKKTDDFWQFKTKIFYTAVWMTVIAVASSYLLYMLFLKGNFANWIVAANQEIFGLDYEAAKTLYRRVFRNHVELIFVIGIAIVFFVLFRIYLDWCAKYLMKINQGIDDIGRAEAGEVSLPPELSAVERKINAIKHRLEKQESDMKLAEQRKNDLIVYLAHDLKTPLASVIGYLNLLRDEGEITEELREKYLSVALDKAERLEDLIDEFFEIAKYNLSHITLQYSRISLKRLLEMLIYEFRPMLREKDLDCRLRAEEDIMLRCDGDKIQRVFGNLLRNAVSYSCRGTNIDISAIVQGESVEIIFTNHGETIPQEKLERIFEQFYRLDPSRGAGSGGAGLGLAIARQIVELHNGTVEAKSVEGTVEFKVSLPLS